MVDDTFYNAKDVMRILQYKRSKAYGVIKRMNQELAEKGIFIRPGMIPRQYFNKRLGLSECEGGNL